MHYNALSLEKKTHKIAPSPWDFARLPKDRATSIGNMHKKFGKDRACGSGDMLVDRKTHRRAHHNTRRHSRRRNKNMAVILRIN